MRLHGLTAPDHTPYLLPTDLRTAEDAAAFVHTYVVDPATEWDLSDVYNYLERRLDRERRQACRRGRWRRGAGSATRPATSTGPASPWTCGGIAAERWTPSPAPSPSAPPRGRSELLRGKAEEVP